MWRNLCCVQEVELQILMPFDTIFVDASKLKYLRQISGDKLSGAIGNTNVGCEMMKFVHSRFKIAGRLKFDPSALAMFHPQLFWISVFSSSNAGECVGWHFLWRSVVS